MRLRRQPDLDDGQGQLADDELQALQRAARAVNTASGVRETLEAILDEAIGLVGADEGSVLLFEEGEQHLRIVAARGIAPDVVASTRIASGEGIVGRVVAQGEPQLLGPDASAESYERARPVRSAVCVPLQASGRTEGALCLNVLAENEEHPGLDEHDLALTSVFAEHVAATVGARRLLENAEQRRQDLDALYELGRALVRAEGGEEIADVLLQTVVDGARTVGAALALRAGAEPWSLVGVEEIHRGRVLAALRRAPADWVVDEPVVVEIAGDDVLEALASDRHRHALLSPLMDDENTSGVLLTLHPRPPAGRLQGRLVAMADQAALALTAERGVADVARKGRELERIVHTIPDPVLLIDGQGRLASLNPAAAERFGLNERFGIGTEVTGRLGSEELEQLARSERSERTELTVGERTYRLRVSLVEPDLGRASPRVVSLQDITTESELRRLKSDFVAVMGHELRTPLTLVKGYASTLAKRGGDLPTEMRERVTSSLNQHTRRLERLIEDLLLVAGIERGRAPLSPEDGDLVEVIREGVEQARKEHPERRIDLRTEQDAVPMHFDRVKVEQVLHHLLSNAVKFSEVDDPIGVIVGGDEDAGRFAVVDRGMGIYSGDIPHLFERFRQIDGTETRAHGGTGVGLYICRTLVDAHGGRIEVRSALSKGSIFTVVLPRQPEDDPRGQGPGQMTVDSGS